MHTFEQGDGILSICLHSAKAYAPGRQKQIIMDFYIRRTQACITLKHPVTHVQYVEPLSRVYAQLKHTLKINFHQQSQVCIAFQYPDPWNK